MIQYLIGTIGVISGLLGLISFFNYVTHPLVNTGALVYTGRNFWVVAFICLIVLYLKG